MPTKQTITVNLYRVLDEAVERGARCGIRRYWKHRDGMPDEATLEGLAEAAAEAVMSELCEYVDFGE